MFTKNRGKARTAYTELGEINKTLYVKVHFVFENIKRKFPN